MAYVKGRNIYDNATCHVDRNVFLKLDFKDFFPSIKAIDWKQFILRTQGTILTADDVGITTNILFWGVRTSIPRCLSIGAPTSPLLSNILLLDLDTKLAALAERRDVGYTRYADDITISGKLVTDVLAFETLVKREVSRMHSPKLIFNDEKRGLYRMGQRRMVTGLIVTPTRQVSIGRQRKRMISALLHRCSLGQLDADQMGLLKGLLGFTIANEASFVGRMRKKYGDTVVDRVLKVEHPRRNAT
jgi:RNA-directed DNA polymerase